MTDKDEVLSFLKKMSIMSIALNGERGPISSPMLFVVDEDFCIYFATRKGSHKAEALLKDTRIGISVWKHEEMSIQYDGEAAPVTDMIVLEKKLDELAEAAAREGDFWPPVLRITETDYIMYKVTPRWVRKLDLKNAAIHANNKMFVQII